DPIFISQCQLAVTDKQDVPSQRDGVLKKIFVKEGETVEEGKVLAQLDDRVAVADQAIKAGKIKAAIADLGASTKTKEEARQRLTTCEKLYPQKGCSLEDLRGAQLTWDRYYAEEISKGEAVELAKLEKQQADIVVEMHQIKSTCPGKIKT